MSEKKYKIILGAVFALGMLSVLALTVYTYLCYKDCSIITYIQNRG